MKSMSNRSLFIFVALISLLFLGPTGHADAGFDIDISIGDNGLKGFYLSIGEHYRVPQREVIIIKERGIPDEEIPVVLFIAARSRIAPAKIIDLRLHGRSWSFITLHFGLSPEIYYVQIKKEVNDPPYGRALGYYKNKPRKEWKKIVLRDDDVINLVNLKFISEYHGYQPEDVIKVREHGRDFVVIDDEFKKEKIKKGEKKEKSEGHGKEKEGHKGKGKK